MCITMGTFLLRKKTLSSILWANLCTPWALPSSIISSTSTMQGRYIVEQVLHLELMKPLH